MSRNDATAQFAADRGSARQLLLNCFSVMSTPLSATNAAISIARDSPY
jgi:hypothetical protein